MSWFSRGHLEIVPKERIVWLYPDDRSTDAARDTLVDGHLVLTLTRAASISDVSIRLLGEATVTSADRSSKGVVLDTSRTLYKPIKEHEKLEAGQHRFEFSLPVPANAPCSLLPRIEHGKIVYRLIAKADGIKSETPISMISSSTDRGGQPPVLDVQVEEVAPELGPLRLQWLSSRFTCGSLIETCLHIVEPKAVLVKSATLCIVEHTDFRHFDRNGHMEGQVVRQSQEQILSRFNKHVDIIVGGASVAGLPFDLQAGRSLDVRHFARLPWPIIHRDKAGPAIRYSDPIGSITPISFRHELFFKLNFDVDGLERQLIIQRPIDLGTCLLVDENTRLPRYQDTAVEPAQTPAQLPRTFINTSDWGARDSERCVCSAYSFDQLLAEHLQQTPQADDEAAKSYKMDGAGA